MCQHEFARHCSASSNRPTPAWSALGDALLIMVSLTQSLFGRVRGTVNVTQYTVHSHYKQKQLLGEILPQPCIHQLA